MTSQLRKGLGEYLAVRRSLGFKLETQARILLQFVAFAEREAASYITHALVSRHHLSDPLRERAS